jgi:hypothetical protein
MIQQHVFFNFEKSQYDITKLILFLKSKVQPFYNMVTLSEVELDEIVKSLSNIDLPLRKGTLDELNNVNYAVKLTNSLIKYINSRFHYEDNEELILDTMTCLTKDINGYPEGTSVLKRETNMCVFYYVDPHFIVKDNTLVSHNSDFEKYKFSKEESDDVAGVLVNLAKDMINFGIGELGADLLTVLFGDEEEIQFKQIQEVFANIVKDANIEQTVNEQGGNINGVLQNMLEFYKNASDKAEYIDDRLANLNRFVEILWKEEFRKKGLPTYLGGQELSFAILQEQYKITKKESVLQTIKDRAKRVSENVSDEHDVLLKERLNKITKIESELVAAHNRARYYFEDQFTGIQYTEETKICFNEKDEEEVIAKITKIREDIVAKITKDMDWINEVTSKLSELQQYPIGGKKA